MIGPTTIITNPEDGDEKKFAFDYSYWSFDGSKEQPNGYFAADPSHPNGKKFCDQVGSWRSKTWGHLGHWETF